MFDNGKVNGLSYRKFIKKYPEYDYETISALYYCAYKMIKNKFFHIDLHWGNLFLNLNESGIVQITLIDYGIVKEINDIEQKCLLDIFNLNSSKKTKETNIIKLFWLLSNKTHDYDNFEKLFNNYMNKNKKQLKFVMDFFYENNIFLSHKNTLFLNSISLILDIFDEQENQQGFYSFLEGYMLENDN